MENISNRSALSIRNWTSQEARQVLWIRIVGIMRPCCCSIMLTSRSSRWIMYTRCYSSSSGFMHGTSTSRPTLRTFKSRKSVTIKSKSSSPSTKIPCDLTNQTQKIESTQLLSNIMEMFYFFFHFIWCSRFCLEKRASKLKQSDRFILCLFIRYSVLRLRSFIYHVHVSTSNIYCFCFHIHNHYNQQHHGETDGVPSIGWITQRHYW